MPNLKSILRKSIFLLAAASFIYTGEKAYAFAPDFYTPSSALSQGNWAKIEVSETGMQFVSEATLKNLGFSDPDKVNVFGYGGVVIPDNLDSPDDLPVVPSKRVPGGIVFFGKGSIGWNVVTNGDMKYSHSSHPYSDNSYYFLSDCLDARRFPEGAEGAKATTDVPVTEFTERVLHEQDLWMPLTSGRLILGEDFRTVSSRNVKLSLPGNTGDAMMALAFGCKAGGNSSLSLTANNKALLATNTDQMAFSDTKLIVTTKTIKKITDPGTNLDLGIKLNSGGSVAMAGLDYIEVEYPRSIDLSAGELYFYISPDEASEVKVAGATGSTEVWDVTDASNPLEMEATLEGSSLVFVSAPGYHEYVAFDPARISRAALPVSGVGNQDLHSLPAPDMLLICPPEYMAAGQRLIDLHAKTDGLEVLMLSPEEIYNEFSSGKPDVSAFRKLLKMWYDRAQGEEGKYPQYCLIMSRPTFDNKMVTPAVQNCGYPRVPIWQSPTGETESSTYSTDDFIGMLEDVQGNFNIGNAVIHVAVGRMPVKSLSEAHTAIDKLENYILNPDFGSWRNKIIVIADDQDNGVHLDQAESVVTRFREEEYGRNFVIEKLYLDSYTMEYSGVGATYPQAHERLQNLWNEGTAYINYIGHANPKSWGHEYLLTWTDITSMSNERLPYIYAATCEFMRWDEEEISGAEYLWLMPSSGIIGAICPSREVLISANGVLNEATAPFVFARDSEGKPLSAGQIMIKGKNNSNTSANKLRYGLIGDPSIRMPWADNKVVVDKINGIEIDSAEDLPVLQARGSVTVSGHLEDTDGVPMTDFNGVVELTLYDAEKIITTNGNGSAGVVAEYNDRKTRLYVGRVKVTDGEWSTDFTMPSEIENNYTPALLSLYASDDSGRQATGHTEKLYAYGYDSNAPDDFDGPKIIEFYLDNPSFVSGNAVSPNPTLYAKFYDESGISVSEAGIGHNITLELDGKTFFDDVAQYYIPDDTDSGAGSLVYALSDVSQGAHTLKFTVWDNANNSTSEIIDFSISALWKPTIATLTTDVNPATSSVNFIIGTDGADSTMECTVDVYDLWGKRVWTGVAPSLNKSAYSTTLGWNLCDSGGGRVPGGIYLYRANVRMENGATVTRTKKLIVRGQ